MKILLKSFLMCHFFWIHWFFLFKKFMSHSLGEFWSGDRSEFLEGFEVFLGAFGEGYMTNFIWLAFQIPIFLLRNSPFSEIHGSFELGGFGCFLCSILVLWGHGNISRLAFKQISTSTSNHSFVLSWENPRGILHYVGESQTFLKDPQDYLNHELVKVTNRLFKLIYRGKLLKWAIRVNRDNTFKKLAPSQINLQRQSI